MVESKNKTENNDVKKAEKASSPEEKYDTKRPRRSSGGGKSEVLSQDEIDQLLNAISSVDSDSKDLKKSKDNRKIKIYDFKRPDRFSREQIRRLSWIFESVCRDLTTILSASLRSLIHVHVASVDQLTVEEFIRSCPTPTTMAILRWEGENAALEIDPAISVAFLNLLNSDKFASLELCLSDLDLNDDQMADVMDAVRSIFCGSPRINRDLTDTEFYILRKAIIDPILKNLTRTFNDWQGKRMFLTSYQNSKTPKNTENLEPLSMPEEIVMESNPQFAQIVSPGEMVALITLEVKAADEEGMINVCLPYPFVKEVLIKKEIIMKDEDLNPFALKVVPGNAGVSLGDFNMPKDKKLEEGTIIELNKCAGEPVDLYDKETGKIFARGEVVVIDENFGVRVTEVL